MKIFDAFGRRVPDPPRTRTSLGFVARELRHDEPPTVNLPSHDADRTPDWHDTGSGDEQPMWGRV